MVARSPRTAQAWRDKFGWIDEEDPSPLQAALWQALSENRDAFATANMNEAALNFLFFRSLSQAGADVLELFLEGAEKAPTVEALVFSDRKTDAVVSEPEFGVDFAIAMWLGKRTLRLALFQAKREKDGKLHFDQENSSTGRRQVFDMVRTGLRFMPGAQWRDLSWLHYIGWRNTAWERRTSAAVESSHSKGLDRLVVGIERAQGHVHDHPLVARAQNILRFDAWRGARPATWSRAGRNGLAHP